MDILLVSLGFLLVIMGLFGSFLPVLPGPALSLVGLALLYYTDAVTANYTILIVMTILTVVIAVLDYVIPAQGTKRYGGSRYGVWGTNIGLLLGILAPIPLGFIIGPFVGAFVGEMIYNASDHRRAFKAATGSFIGFLASTFMKFILCVIFLGIYLSALWSHRNQLFG
jgi:uncharacterized protein